MHDRRDGLRYERKEEIERSWLPNNEDQTTIFSFYSYSPRRASVQSLKTSGSDANYEQYYVPRVYKTTGFGEIESHEASIETFLSRLHSIWSSGRGKRQRQMAAYCRTQLRKFCFGVLIIFRTCTVVTRVCMYLPSNSLP